ncbi:hypothetical protein BDW02DRAFT_614119 [Decorospora gaudefroyi]|uniref:Uncharacterized protein n=1 Tax=Decorospora gaudefroyi TaxID=184978 RepID=A0A6A5KIG1_9PLEO|nr:hypothetical protein BDW02DRAFT_614119 [Decorospora gaudefroyi]
MGSVSSGLPDNRPGDPEPSSSSGISETVFQLLVMFWTDLSADGVLEGKAIIHFSGVLGIHPYELAYRTAYDYTPYLSALLWVGRLVILEYALPLRAYTTLDVPSPARATYVDQGKRLCADIPPVYLQRGSFSPMGYLIERLQHGSRITMQESRQTIHSLVARLEQATRKLMFDWWPKVELSTLKDDLAKHRPGYSFLQEPANQLQSSFKHLSRRAFSKDGGGFALRGKSREQVMLYVSVEMLTPDTPDTPTRKQHKVTVQYRSCLHTFDATTSTASRDKQYDNSPQTVDAVKYANPAQTFNAAMPSRAPALRQHI